MNKPYAWETKTPDNKPFLSYEPSGIIEAESIPLYTHPVKELTDEEIEECYWGDGYPDNPRHPKEFAYAILRKEQEK